jgi:hypothetical protein
MRFLIRLGKTARVMAARGATVARPIAGRRVNGKRTIVRQHAALLTGPHDEGLRFSRWI